MRIYESDGEHLVRLKKEYESIVHSNHILSYYQFQRFAYLKREIERLERLCGE